MADDVTEWFETGSVCTHKVITNINAGLPASLYED